MLTIFFRRLIFFLLVPASVSVMVFVVINWLPKNYVSELRIDFSVIGNHSNNSELEGLKSFASHRVKDLFESPEIIREVSLSSGMPLASGQVKTRFDPNFRKISVRVTASTASDAKLLGDALLKAAISSSQPKNEDRARLEADLERIKNNIILLEAAYFRLSESLPNSTNPHELGVLAGAFTQVMEYKTTLEKQRILTTIRLAGIPGEAIVMRPTLPAEAMDPRRVLWSLIAGLATLCLMIGIILLQKAWFDFQLSNRSTNHQAVEQEKHKADSSTV